jgi:hypoxanthine phosphoribosyltransferase
MADLVRSIDPCPAGLEVNFIKASSYGSRTESSGKVSLHHNITDKLVQGRHVILVIQLGMDPIYLDKEGLKS